MQTGQPLILRARVVLPISGPALHDGAVVVKGKHVAAVGRWGDLAGQFPRNRMDLGDVVLLPGLVNAHCHLDYTAMAGQFPPPKLFSDWLKDITVVKVQWSISDYTASWLAGAQMLLRNGTTTVADIEAVPDLLPKMWRRTPLRILSLLELIGIGKHRPPADVLEVARRKLTTLKDPPGRVGLSPHALYSTVPALLLPAAQTARRRDWLVSTHVAESAMEFAMFVHGRGEMYDWMKASGRDTSDCGTGSPVQLLDRCGLLGKSFLAVHVNYLARGDAALLAQRRVSVVHCPRSHFYFRHEPFALEKLARAGVNLCLGTDSLASVYKTRRQTLELSMFDEMRVLIDRKPWLSPRRILRMATLNGARALGLEGQIGELRRGSLADLIAVPLNPSSQDAYETVVSHQGPVLASMISGRWTIPPREAHTARKGTELGCEVSTTEANRE